MGMLYYLSHVEATAGNKAEAYAAFWREAINRTNAGPWQRLFNNPLWGGLQHLTKGDLLEAKDIAAQLAKDSAILWGSITEKGPEVEAIPTLIGSIRAEWDRAGIPEEIRNHKDLLAYFIHEVLPLFPEDNEAQSAAMSIGKYIDDEIMHYIRETLKKLRLLAAIPEYIYINTPLSTDQLKRLYNTLASRHYITRDSWGDFLRCFDSFALASGYIHWKQKGKSGEANKRSMCEFLALLGVDRKLWAAYLRALFHEEISPAALSNAAAGIKAAESGITTIRAGRSGKVELKPSECYEELKTIIQSL